MLAKLAAAEPQAGRHAPSTGERAALKCDEMQIVTNTAAEYDQVWQRAFVWNNHCSTKEY